MSTATNSHAGGGGANRSDTGVPLAEKVSIVLLTYNCGHRLVEPLRRLRALGIPVIAVDNCSSDDTTDVLRTWPEIDLVELPVNIGAAARTVGARRARTPYVAFCDDDGWYDAAGLRIAADLLDAHPTLALVNARILVGESEYLDPISAEMARSPLPDHDGIPGAVLVGFMGGACIMRKDAYEEIGGYDPRIFMGGEEESLALEFLRAGWQLRYIPDVVMWHRPSQANAPFLRAHGLRNALWSAWTYRRGLGIVSRTLFLLIDRQVDEHWWRGLRMAVAGVPRIVRSRRPVDAELERSLAVLDAERWRRRR
jgi:GT2 family glycosyltransferase